MKSKFVDIYLTSLRKLAQIQLSKNKPLIIGITGSAGKSSAVKTTAGLLSQNFETRYTKKGNSQTGIPMEILGIPVGDYSLKRWLITFPQALKSLLFDWSKYKIFVAEMGIDSNKAPNDMDTLLKIFRPKIGVLLNVNSVHSGNFLGEQTIQAVADEKAKMLFALPKDGLAIYNADQPEFKNLEAKIEATIQTFGQSSGDMRLTSHQVSLERSIFEAEFKKNKIIISLENQLVFKEAFGSLASSLLIALYLSINLEQAVQDLEKTFKTLPGRGKMFAGINDSIIVDSSYNSSLVPTISSLEMLSIIAKRKHRKIAILGDMRELGKSAKHDHEELERVAKQNADVIVTIGPLTQKYFKDKNVKNFINPFESISYLKDLIKKDDLILIKGSQNTILLETIVAELLKNKSDQKFLCRRSAYWDRERKKLRKETT